MHTRIRTRSATPAARRANPPMRLRYSHLRTIRAVGAGGTVSRDTDNSLSPCARGRRHVFHFTGVPGRSFQYMSAFHTMENSW